jgi:hypothetical protein
VARCRELAAQVALQVVALADGIEDHVAAPGFRGSDAALCSFSDAPLRRTHGARGNSTLRLRRTPHAAAVNNQPSSRGHGTGPSLR